MKTPTLKLFFLLLFAFSLLGGCGGERIKPTDSVTTGATDGAEPHADSEQQPDLKAQADALLAEADDSDDFGEQAHYRLQAARLYLQAGDTGSARAQQALVAELYQGQSISETQLADLQLLQVTLAVADSNASLAAQRLNELKPVSREQQIEYYALKADIDYLNGKYLHAVDRRVQLASYLTDKSAIDRNQHKIWAALSAMSDARLKTYSSNATIRGWLELARVMRNNQQNVSQLEDRLLDWGTRNPTHPAAEGFLAELVDIYQQDSTQQKTIAVILPLQGKLASVSATIKNGILSAYYADNSPLKPQIHFYDSSDSSVTFHQLYLQAMDEGASHIIGPLNKLDINRLAQQHDMDVPVLSLNYAENEQQQAINLFQFGLSPEDEARQMAELAINQGLMTAAVFYPDSDWGKRLNTAFSEHFTALGGRVLTRGNYATNTNDYRRPIRSMLNLDQSDIRRRKLENMLGKKLQSEPRRRQDIDLIFLAATHRSARSIMPAFKFHHAGNVPVYATSHVYTGKLDRELDRDLNGLVFCDMPWVLNNDSPLAMTFRNNWPQQQSLTRLFAFGLDAYHLVFNLDYLKNRDYAVYNGETGKIRLDAYNRVHRQLLFARFERGIAVAFEPQEPDQPASGP